VKALEFVDPRELVDEFARSIRLELDYGHEARNADAFYRSFANDPRVVVPRVIRQYSSARVLTLEFLHGTKVADLDLEVMRPDERRDVVTRMADAWMTMVFRHGFFHADPHPANIFILDSGELGLVDFGQAGKLTDVARHGSSSTPRRRTSTRSPVTCGSWVCATTPRASWSSAPNSGRSSTATSALASPTSTRCR
jgi:predicted unusual protein kinase regulating ubiquinone biosynthesis (AarF/ABC1/UbiB family)